VPCSTSRDSISAYWRQGSETRPKLEQIEGDKRNLAIMLKTTCNRRPTKMLLLMDATAPVIQQSADKHAIELRMGPRPLALPDQYPDRQRSDDYRNGDQEQHSGAAIRVVPVFLGQCTRWRCPLCPFLTTDGGLPPPERSSPPGKNRTKTLKASQGHLGWLPRVFFEVATPEILTKFRY
jgi:hypothetical protein